MLVCLKQRFSLGVILFPKGTFGTVQRHFFIGTGVKDAIGNQLLEARDSAKTSTTWDRTTKMNYLTQNNPDQIIS